MTAPLCRCGKLTAFVRHQDAAPIEDDGAVDLDTIWAAPACDVYRCECGLWHIIDASPPPSDEIRAFLAEHGIEARS